MNQTNFNPQNILILNLGQLGDVILSLPALKAIRKKFPQSKITLLIGKSTVQIVDMAGFADERIVVDRVKLRDSNKFWSIGEIFKLVGEIRRKKFDFIIDLHSLYESNLLGYFSGAKIRLFGNRENRSLDFLSNFHPKPPLEDKSKHLTDKYLDVLRPLGIESLDRNIQVLPRAEDLDAVKKIWQDLGLKDSVIGLFPGAGNPSRRWALEKFGELSKLFKETNQVAVFLGPEEIDWKAEVREKFSPEVIIFDKLNLPQTVGALSLLKVLVSNDTGVAHLGATAKTSVVVIMDENAPTTYLPLTEKLSVIRSGKISEISVNEVFQAVKKML